MAWIGRIAAIAALVACALAAPAQASTRAEYVVDARSGEVLLSKNATTALPPASLTKMMTLYLVFEAVRDGKLRLDQKVPVSRRAARQPASKIGFRAGQRVRVRELIRAAAVKSANDAAMVLAEAVAGSEERFARLMTRRARALGMTNSRFKNASGLTARGHVSTARDMALLGRRLFYDFPKYYNLFGRVTTPAFGRTLYNTNKLLRTYRGATGIKTGYTRAAGYNLVASAERGKKRVIAVVFGGSSSAARNKRVAALLDYGFAKSPRYARERRPRGPLLARAPGAMPPPPRRPGAASSDAPVAAAIASLVAAQPAPRPTTQAGPAAASLAALARPVPPPRDPEAAPPPPGDWALQLGDYAQREAAEALLTSSDLGEIPALRGASRELRESRLGSASLYSPRLTGLSPRAAHDACRTLRANGRNCEAIPPAN